VVEGVERVDVGVLGEVRVEGEAEQAAVALVVDLFAEVCE